MWIHTHRLVCVAIIILEDEVMNLSESEEGTWEELKGVELGLETGNTVLLHGILKIKVYTLTIK